MNTRMDHINIQLILAITFLFLTSFSLSASATCNAQDKKALLAFKNSFPNGSFPDYWDEEDNCCFWGGIDCDFNNRVNSIFFTTDTSDSDYFPVNLTGPIPASVGDLTALQSFGLVGFTGLTGPIPPRMANLKNMKYFIISNSGVSGPIPSFISTSFEQLQINSCKLTGSIPPSLGNLANLSIIAFTNNKLTGTIPASLFSKLKINGSQPLLSLNNNMLTGPIPQSFASIDSLRIDVSDNQLCGPIPTGGVFPSLNPMYVAHNKCLCGPPLEACK